MADTADNIRVLIADDHEISRAGYIRMLSVDPAIEIAGEASNGAEAVELTGFLAPDIVILDMKMPGIDGKTAAGIIREKYPSVKIILIISYDCYHSLGDALRLGLDGYLALDICTFDLIEAIHKVYDGRKIIYKNILKFIKSRNNNGKFMPEHDRGNLLLKLPEVMEYVNGDYLKVFADKTTEINFLH